ncbi:protein kinase [Vibrio renipiscarius]|uniref:protein kinase n=1 Tax=Vibrio renipiscarius TaxID=1461322 RepID=UPI00354E7F10
MHTVEQLVSGELDGTTHLYLKQGLAEFPREIINLADSLEVLDLSDNQLQNLPDDFSQLKQLRILFLTNNCFTAIPTVLAQCPKLEMISFKSNKLQHIPERSLPDQTRWLILTDNHITQLPDDMGRLYRLQKLALAGNALTALPESMASCQNLELARLSANKLESLPDWLFQLPKLSWLAIDGNPLSTNPLEPSLFLSPHSHRESDHAEAQAPTIPLVALDDIQLEEVIGQGASGIIYRAKWSNQPDELQGTDQEIAVKIFKGEVTSDGYPQDELLNCLQAGQHKNLIKVIARIEQPNALGLVMELIPSHYHNLGLPPSLQTCTRDTFAPDSKFELKTIVTMLEQMASGLAHLHQHHVSHGDIYAHNTMYNADANVLFGDFGAATNLSKLPTSQRAAMQHIEVRALGCLIEDLLSYCLVNDEDLSHITELTQLKTECMQPDLAQRPRFEQIAHQLQQRLQQQ